jgi:hypothetical protein
MEWLVAVALILIALTGLYAVAMQSVVGAWTTGAEGYADYIGAEPSGPDGVMPEVASFSSVTQPLMGDVIPVQTGLTPYTAAAVAAIDRSRSMELGGQYVQRTNNYAHLYPDNWTAPLSELVGSIYKPRDGVGLVVPCSGAC